MNKNMNNFMNSVVTLLVGVIDWLVFHLLLAREWLRPTPPDVPKVYTGGEPILPDNEVLKVQPALIALVGEKKATILQKVHEWVQVNMKKGTHQFKGETWTYGSYQDWHERHFDWFTPGYLGKLFSQLVTDGYLVATSDAPFCFKGQNAYRVNYDAILQVGVVQKVTPPYANSDEGLGKKCVTPTQKLPNNKVVITSTLNNPFKDKQTNKHLTQFEEPALDTSDGTDVAVVGGENPQHDSGVYENLSAEAVTDTSEFLVLEDGIGKPIESAEAVAWETTYNQLEEEWDEANFNTWLHPTTFLCVEDGKYIIGVPNSTIADTLQYRMYEDVRNILGHDIEYRVHRPKPSIEELNQETPLFRLIADRESEPSLAEDLCRWFEGMTMVTAAGLADQYEEGWVRVVAQHARTQNNLKNPVGFLISELKTNRLGLKDQPAVVASTGYTDGNWADIIKS